MIKNNNYNSINKKNLRDTLLLRRNSFDKESHTNNSKKIVCHLKKWIQDNKISTLFLFYPFRNEPNILSLTDQIGRNCSIALPVISKNKNMSFHRWLPNKTNLQYNKFRIKEPKVIETYPLVPDENTLLCIPSLAVDLNGNRLGYGAGYYDIYLKNVPNIQHMVILFDDFVLKKLPKDSWDYPIQQICTENGIKNL